MPTPSTPQAQLVRISTESATPTPINAVAKTWAQTFPKQVESAEQSLKFVQKLLAVGVSSVAYLRNTFPEEAFKPGKALGKVPIRMLKSTNPIKEAGCLAAYILSAMEAIGQKFLRELHLIIHHDGNLNTVLEVYTFRITYPEDGNVLLEVGVERDGSREVRQANIKKDTVSLLQSLLDHTQGLPPLPDNCFITVDLTYYDEKVPVDYQPEGFKESAIFQMPSGANKVECGSVSTNYHALAVQVVKVNHAEDGPSVRRMALDEQGDADVQDGQASHQYLEYGEVAGNAGVTCVCGSLVRDPLMLKCGHCGVEEHAACYAIVGETYAPAQHCCLRCGNGATEGFVCSDPKLAAKKPECVSNYCTYRRTLVILLTEEFGNMHELVSRLGVEQDYGEHLFNKLCEDGVISSGDGINFMIYQENLEKAMGKRFGGKWEEGAAEKSRGEGNDEVTNTAGGAKDEEQDQEGGRKFVSGGERGQSMPMKEKAAKSGNVGFKRVKQLKMSSSGLLDVSLGVEYKGAEEIVGARKRKSTTRGRKMSEGEVAAATDGDLGKKKRRGRGK